jgi:hypothetical protein
MWPSHVGSKELLKKQSLPAKTAGQFVFSFDVWPVEVPAFLELRIHVVFTSWRACFMNHAVRLHPPAGSILLGLNLFCQMNVNSVMWSLSLDLKLSIHLYIHPYILSYLPKFHVSLSLCPSMCLPIYVYVSVSVCVKTESNGIWSIYSHNTNIYRCIYLYIQTVFGPYTTAGPLRAVWFWASCAGLFLWHHISPSLSLQVASAGIP